MSLILIGTFLFTTLVYQDLDYVAKNSPTRSKRLQEFESMLFGELETLCQYTGMKTVGKVALRLPKKFARE